MKLYVTDWNPSGVNDLLLVDENHEVIDCLPEATFGIDVSGCKETALILDGTDWLAPIDIDLAEEAEETCTMVGAVDLFTVNRKLAVSPAMSADEARERLVKFLARNKAA